jgi:hypothetical protein
MKREKFLHDAKLDPSRFYRSPGDVIRDRRLSNDDRLQILDSWARGVADEDDDAMRHEIRRIRDQVENGSYPMAHRDRDRAVT